MHANVRSAIKCPTESIIIFRNMLSKILQKNYSRRKIHGKLVKIHERYLGQGIQEWTK